MRTSETICDRCGQRTKNSGYCPECEENLCWECADWVQSGADLICRACKDEEALPTGTYVPYHQYSYMFDEALSLSVVKAQDKLPQAKWRILPLTQQETIVEELENNETMTKVWKRLVEMRRNERTRKKTENS